MTLEQLSGRLDSVETAILHLQQNILQRPDLAAFSNFQIIWNQSHDTISDNIETLISRVQALYSLYTNLNITVSNNQALFTGHSGQTGIHFLETLDVVNLTGNYTGTSTDNIFLLDATSAPFTVTMPNVSTVSGRAYLFKKLDNTANAVTVTGNATFDGSLSYQVTGQYSYSSLVSDGTKWLLY